MHLYNTQYEIKRSIKPLIYSQVINPRIANVDPLTTDYFRWDRIHPHFTTIRVMPLHSTTNNMNSPTTHSESDSSDGELYEEKIDYSTLSNVDPDTNLATNSHQLDCQYYTENTFNTKFPPSDKFSIFHVNMRSIPNNLDKLIYYLEGIQHTFNIIAISETWLQEHNKTLYNIRGYNHEYVIRTNRVGGGVSLFIHSSLNYKVRTDLTLSLEDVNILFIEIPKSEHKTKRKILLGLCYRPPNVNQLEFLDQFDVLLAKIHKEAAYTYITGDTNFNTLNLSPSKNSPANEYHNMFLSYSFQSLIDKATREQNGSSTLIDHYYTDIPQSYQNCKTAILKADIADHYSIICITDHIANTNKNVTILKRNVCNKNKATFRKKIKLQSWQYIYNMNNIQTAFTYFQKQFTYMFEESFPEIHLNITYKNRLPWMTKGLRESIAHKHRLRDTYQKTPSEENKKIYKSYHNKLTSLMRTSERNYYEQQLDLNKQDLKKSWKVIKEIINRTDNTKDSQMEYLVNNKLTNDNDLIVNAFNDYFIEIVPKLATDVTSDMDYIANISNSIFIPYTT